MSKYCKRCLLKVNHFLTYINIIIVYHPLSMLRTILVVFPQSSSSNSFSPMPSPRDFKSCRTHTSHINFMHGGFGATFLWPDAPRDANPLVVCWIAHPKAELQVTKKELFVLTRPVEWLLSLTSSYPGGTLLERK